MTLPRIVVHIVKYNIILQGSIQQPGFLSSEGNSVVTPKRKWSHNKQVKRSVPNFIALINREVCACEGHSRLQGKRPVPVLAAQEKNA